MNPLFDTQELPEIVRKEDERGNIIYLLSNGLVYDHRGSIIKTKIENCLLKNSNQTTNESKQTQKTTQKTLSKLLFKMAQTTEFFEGVHEFTEGIVKILHDKFNGQTLGEGGVTMEDMMKELFGDYKPGDKVKQVKKSKKKKETNDAPKNKKKPSGYNYFMGLEIKKMKENEPSMEHKERFTLAAGKWKGLSEDEQAEWKQKAAASVEE